MLRRFNLSIVIAFDGAHVHTSYVVYVHGGGISEGVLRSFNSSMIIVLDGSHVSYLT